MNSRRTCTYVFSVLFCAHGHYQSITTANGDQNAESKQVAEQLGGGALTGAEDGVNCEGRPWPDGLLLRERACLLAPAGQYGPVNAGFLRATSSSTAMTSSPDHHDYQAIRSDLLLFLVRARRTNFSL